MRDFKINIGQIKKIHIAAAALGLSRNEYEDDLEAQFGKRSSKDLTFTEAEQLLEKYRQAGWIEKITNRSNTKVKNQYGFGKKKYENLRGRGKPFADPRKLRMIEVLWRQASRQKTDEALQNFIYNRTGISHITMLWDCHANIVITALNAMQKRTKEENGNVDLP